MDTKRVIAIASQHIEGLANHAFDLLTVSRPVSVAAAVNLAKVVSKLSPMLGNLIEFNTVEVLNQEPEFTDWGNWIRQDPGFPDAVFVGNVAPIPGLEIKAWFPLATEITARFKDSSLAFALDNTYVALLAWLPEKLIYGVPRILDACVVSGLSVARARDSHYHRPPFYLVIEPEDTTQRTANLQQTNTAGYVWQGTDVQFREAEEIVASWGRKGTVYSATREYQVKLRGLMGRFPQGYRNDTNFSKIDRIEHAEIEAFKSRVLARDFCGMSVGKWARLLASDDTARIAHALETHLGITEASAGALLR